MAGDTKFGQRTQPYRTGSLVRAVADEEEIK